MRYINSSISIINDELKSNFYNGLNKNEKLKSL